MSTTNITSRKDVSETTLKEIAETCHLPLDQIEDVYACTPFQAGVMAESQQHGAMYQLRYIFSLGPNLDIDRFCTAVHQVLALNAVLRTRIVDCDDVGLVQVVVKDACCTQRLDQSLAYYLKDDRAHAMNLGMPLLRSAIVDRRWILSTHHAIGDRHSALALIDDVSHIYHGQTPETHAPFKAFVEYYNSIDESMAKSFWKSQFTSISTIYPPVKPMHSVDAADQLSRNISLKGLRTSASPALMPSYIEIAWALTVQAYTNSSNIAVGFVMSGRTPALAHIATTLGPTLSTVPVQIRLSPDMTVKQALTERARERRLLLVNPALQFGLPNIRKLGEEARVASNFQTIINIMSISKSSSDTADIKFEDEDEVHMGHGLCLNFSLDPEHVLVEATFDSAVLGNGQVERILYQIEHTLCRLLEASPTTKLAHLPVLNKHDLGEILEWNKTIPPSKEECLHDLFRSQVGRNQTANSVDAWDGTITYRELDEMSDRLAQELARRNVSLESAVPFVFEKSLFAVVAVLAILKAGGACVPIDPGHPQARQQDIISMCKAKLVLTSSACYEAVAQIAPNVFAVNSASVSELPAAAAISRASAPSQAAFILFTSGSSGQPKGVVLEHHSLVSSLCSIGARLDFRHSLRVLQFAAHIWDASLLEILGTLLFGGCICIPSEEDRETNLVHFMNSHEVEFALLTPTLLRTISPADVPTLKTLVSGGEAVDRNAVNIWGSSVRFFNCFGPCEASIITSTAELTHDSPYPESIGFSTGCATWIVDPSNVNKLCPIGAIGELVIEGAGVARCYLDDPGKTAASFIRPPSWALDRRDATSRRFYRCGDLAKYNADGSITLCGRADNQVKMRGQRFELGEIESTLAGSEFVREVVTIAQAPSQLVAVLTLANSQPPSMKNLKEVSESQRDRYLCHIREHIESRLPPFMVPNIWLVVEQLPRLPSAKLDRASIKTWLSGIDLLSRRAVHASESDLSVEAPKSAEEVLMQSVWAAVLAISEQEIGRQSSFQGLGGDSISAMQVANRCRLRGVKVTVAALIRSSNLAAAAASCQKVATIPDPHLRNGTSEILSSPLSPVQALFTNSSGPALHHHFNQSVFLELRTAVSPSALRQALDRLVAHHSMLRASFSQSDSGEWAQTISLKAKDAWRIRVHSADADKQIQDIVDATEMCFDITLGPMFAADLILPVNQPGISYLFLCAHHLIVDMVSWRVLLEDLETLLRLPESSLPEGFPFLSWIQHQADSVKDVQPFQPPPEVDLNFWNMCNTAALYGCSVQKRFSLDLASTNAIMSACNLAFDTTPTELMLTAALVSFHKVFPDRGHIAVFTESHGRDNPVIDLSRTVGWFTTLFPLMADVTDTTSIEDAVAEVKDCYRQISPLARAKFTSTMLARDPLRVADFELMFNFLGRIQQVERDDGLFKMASTDTVRVNNVADDVQQISLLSVTTAILDGCLQFWVDYNKNMAHQKRLERWVLELQRTLTILATELPRKEIRLTLSDMPLLRTDRESLQSIHERLRDCDIAPSNVQTIYPCTPLQEGILLARSKSDKPVYWQRLTFMVTPRDPSEKIDTSRLIDAWHTVCEASPILRTVFTSGLCDESAFQQVILKETVPCVSISTLNSDSDIHTMVRNLEKPSFNPAQPPNRLVVVQESSCIYAVIDITHAAMDAHAINLLCELLGQAYTGESFVPRGPDFADYVAWIQNHRDKAQKYWKSYLAGGKPSLIPTLGTDSKGGDTDATLQVKIPFSDVAMLHSLCRKYTLTVSNIVQVAWSIVLRLYTGMKSLFFGCVFSGRNTFEGAEQVIGPLATMLVSRFDVTSTTTVLDLLEKAKEDSSDAFEHSACSLSQVFDSLDLGDSPLFNTALTIRPLWSEDLAVRGAIKMVPVEIDDPSEYPVSIGVGYSKESFESRLIYRSSYVDESFASQIAQTFATAIEKIIEAPEQLISSVTSCLEISVAAPAPLALVASDAVDEVKRKAASQCHVQRSRIQDIYPCTPIQGSLMKASVAGGGKCFTHRILKVDKHEIDQFCDAWNAVESAIPGLRTRIVSLDGLGDFQVILKPMPSWAEEEDLEEYLKWDQDAGIQYGSPLCHFCRIDQPNGDHYICLSLHEAICDAWTLGIVAEAVEKAFNGQNLRTMPSSNAFVRYLTDRSLIDRGKEYWKHHLKGFENLTTFPPLTTTASRAVPNTSTAFKMAIRGDTDASTLPALLQAAWALCMSRLTGNAKVSFGVLLDARDAPVEGITELTGFTAAIAPCAINVPPAASGRSFVRDVQAHLTEMLPFAHTGMHNIRSTGNSAAFFNNLLAIHTSEVKAKLLGVVRGPTTPAMAGNMALVTTCRVTPEETFIEMAFDSRVVSPDQVTILLRQYELSILQLTNSDENTPLSGYECLSDHELSLLARWTTDAPVAIESCIHDQVTDMARCQPSALAICSWDHGLDYGQLTNLSNRLAIRLRDAGVRAETIVPFLCEKSAVAVVIMLAILKAGGVMLAMDINHPTDRLDAILDEVDAPVIVCSPDLRDKLKTRISKIIVVDLGYVQGLPITTGLKPGIVGPSNACYVIYTSGSTGKPKGVAVPHSAIATSLSHSRVQVGAGVNTRTFQFANFAFDASIFEIFLTLLAGGCVCIPSEEQRTNDVAGAINQFHANFAVLTPTVATLLSPSEVPTLGSLMLVGEAMSKRNVDVWAKEVRLMNGYGPSETAICSSVNTSITSSESCGSIGQPAGCWYWVVDANDHDKLVPIGCEGELLIQGPIVARGYHQNDELTTAAFIDNPAWTTKLKVDLPQRMYKTGDLVVQAADGSVAYRGRKGNLVKLRGLRIELAEIEHHLLQHLEPGRQLAVEVIQPIGQVGDALLAAFFTGKDRLDGASGEHSTAKGDLLGPQPETAAAFRQVLADALPSYMVPEIYVPMKKLPLTSSGKTDRRSLRETGARISPEEHLAYNGLNPTRLSTEPTNDYPEMSVEEACMQQLWSTILSIPAESISITDSFMALGGNSLRAIRLVAAGRKQGLSFTVADVFKQPRLSDLAKVRRTPANHNSMGVITPFSLLTGSVDINIVRKQAASLCGVEESQIEDIFPCTALQESLVAMTARRPGDYVAKLTLELGPAVDVSRFKQAFEEVYSRIPILRTRIINLQDYGSVQVVLNEKVRWAQYESLEEAKQQCAMSFGTALNQVGLFRSNEDGKTWFVWTVHHALYDGWSMDSMLESIDGAYSGSGVSPPVPFQEFIKHTLAVSNEALKSFWHTQFAGLEAQQFPALPSATYKTQPNMVFEHTIKHLSRPPGTFTMPTAIRAAWATLVAWYTNSSEAAFGAVVSGRQSDLAGVDQIVGPCIATVPIRVIVRPDMSVEQLLQQVQDQASGHDAVRADRIAEHPAQACRFQTLLVVQPPRNQASTQAGSAIFQPSSLDSPGPSSEPSSSNHAMMLVFREEDKCLRLHFSFDSRVLHEAQVARLAQQLEHVLQQMCQPSTQQTLIRNIARTSAHDQLDIWRWNASVPATSDTLVSDLIQLSVQRQPEAQAICAHDGSLTYCQLDALSTRLARSLVKIGVKPEVVVPVVFEKSMWTAVAVLAVMKAGGASVVLDVTQPEERLSTIMHQLEFVLVLTSPSQYKLASTLAEDITVLVVTQMHIDQLSDESELSKVEPSNALYIVFTSGSTGQPKGAIITHANFSSAHLHQAKLIGFDSGSRVLDFASYAFDMSWYNLLHTLSCGGCLCVPGEDEKRNDLAGAIARLNANFINTTPTVAGLLEDDALQRLTKLELVGETPSAELVSRLKHKASNGYGPAECTMIVARSEDMRQPGHIGYGAGAVTWVVDPENPAMLSPVGCVGELWLEGPLVGRGYLNDPARTVASFIEDPAWLLHKAPGYPGRRGRLYRTGDLVRYEEDGSLIFLGRKDGQVKVRGQRVELGEIEYHLRRLLNDSEAIGEPQVVAELVTPYGLPRAMLVAFVVPLGAAAMTDDDLHLTVASLTRDMDARLSVPQYMIPSLYVPLRAIPTTQTGKRDRRALRELGASIKLDNSRSKKDIVAPANEVERTLREIWGHVLNTSASSISVEATFSRLGGDSITGMHVISRCRNSGLALSLGDLFKFQTIRLLSRRCKPMPHMGKSNVQVSETMEVRFPLSPIQEWYIECQSEANICFDVYRLIRLKTRTTPQAARKSLEDIIQRHSMLRARFEQDQDDKWVQFIRHDVESSLYFEDANVNGDDLGPLISRCRGMLNIKKGPLVSTALIESGSSQFLFIDVHHLLVDWTSMNLLLKDLELSLSGHRLLPTRSTSFQRWCIAQAKYASETLDPTVALPVQLEPPKLDYWDLNEGQVRNGRQAVHKFTLDRETTSRIFGPCTETLQAQPLELMIAALTHSFTQVFADRPVPTCFTAGHGRESWEDTMDVSQTVGWFSTMYPVQLQNSECADLSSAIHNTKDCIRSLPRPDWSYFTSRYLNAKGKRAFKTGCVELNFNYLGGFDHLERTTSLFENMDIPTHVEPESASLVNLWSVFYVTAYVSEGRLEMTLHYHEGINQREHVHRWMDRCEQDFIEMAQVKGQDGQHLKS
ncbi:hypothetical protein BKA56DRAFT_710304 [Ilyonectria sp. MPI-CAGE-AT-0026]|nr:hypothetical protein BKA56DRAFT_710304 [Ilyonectria sp. MPI-CAGE-AT-0026]